MQKVATMCKSNSRVVEACEVLWRRDHEMEECTFDPVTRDAPEYIARHARAYASLRRATAEPKRKAARQQPEWR